MIDDGTRAGALSDEDRVVAGSLLSLLTVGLYGAMDLGTLCALWPASTNPRRFLAESYVEPLCALMVVLRMVLKRTQQRWDALDAVSDLIKQYTESLTRLHDFRDMAQEEVRATVDRLREAAVALHPAIRRLGEELGVQIEPLKKMTDRRQSYYRRILDHLDEILMRAR